MLDKWVESDIKNLFEKQEYDRIVVIDKDGDLEAVLQTISCNLKVEYICVNDDISELESKYRIEKDLRGQKILIRSARPLEQMKFCREYAATGGAIAENLARYVRNKLKLELDFDIELNDKELITAGIQSIGKGKKYWQGLFPDGEIFSSKDVLKFLKNPKDFEKKNKKSMNVFYAKIEKYSDNETKNKPAETVAKEIAISILSNIQTKNSKDHFSEIYKEWLQLRDYEQTLKQYADIFPQERLDEPDFAALNPDHPFIKLDTKCLEAVLQGIKNGNIDESAKEFIQQRGKSEAARIIGADWWSDVNDLCFIELPAVTTIKNIDSFISEYNKTLWKLDSAHRKLYSEFMGQSNVIDEFQQLYDNKMRPYLKRWFEFFKQEYSENQSDLIKNILDGKENPIAVIVGDAISLSIGNEIRSKLNPSIQSSLHVIKSSYPSETANNMSALFSCKGAILKTRKEREERLIRTLGCEIDFFDLDKFWTPGNRHLVLYAPDIDRLGEKAGQSALKYYDTTIETVVKKIDFLLMNKYSEVHLVSDHGFIIYGDISEADKTEDTLPVVKETKERYIISNEKIDLKEKDWDFIEKPDTGYIYYKKSFSPFKTTGKYGFAHGGMTPQELLTPHLKCCLKAGSGESKINVVISNRPQLENLAGDNVIIKLQGQKDVDGDRKVEVIIKDNSKIIYTSDIMTIRGGQEMQREFSVSHSKYDIVIQDAITKETLDKISINKQSARDFGGLL